MSVELSNRGEGPASNGELHDDVSEGNLDTKRLLTPRRRQTGGYEEIAMDIGRPSPDGTALLLESMSHEIMRLRVATGGLAIFAVLATFVAIGLAITRWDASAPPPVGRSPCFDNSIYQDYGPIAKQIISVATSGPSFGDEIHKRLEKLCFTFGPRFSGTDALNSAIDWVAEEMTLDGLEKVHKEAVANISNWKRNEEWVYMLQPRLLELPMLGLGGSVAGNVQGQLIAVADWDELHLRADEVAGKIVLFNVPFTTYSETVQYRYRGAIEAGRLGAIGALLRSVSSFSMGNPHTGATRYEEGTQPIPFAAIAVEAADLIQGLLGTGQAVEVHLQMTAQTEAPAQAFNVMGQVTGGMTPDEVVVLGGHIDSWDVGLGAMDDGAGLLVCWHAVRLIHTLGLRPRRTIRVVGWANEEQGRVNGVLGADVYAAKHRDERHVLAIESDSGAFNPLGFTYLGPDSALRTMQALSGTLLGALNATQVVNGTGTGADVLPMYETQGTPALELLTDATRYFWYHHSVADTPDKMDPDELARCAATLAVIAYTVADLEQPLYIPR
ncbi:plasma glutamate carboxypeptidase-like protein [Klebsormidium nitens]|uniref:Carboxypeptidase Q n=1 Tax=Klebsormidium nitens TaxID=105231 RepID=A0A1Y1IPJ9_KLENI|nr:plasma glutamate carboxypeptidase-like protein [Klebsormidium nitens]|eukprot:GAQ92760.1 plasma glutamate carboxypeptidase-like protein [Klebsormidium nitens]